MVAGNVAFGQGWALLLDVDGLFNSSPAPVRFFVEDQDRAVIDVVFVVVYMMSNWGGGVVMTLTPVFFVFKKKFNSIF